MVDTDTDGSMMLLTDIKKWYKFRLYLLQFLGILLIRILQVFEYTTWIDVITRVDTYLLTILGSDISHMSREMNISNKRSHITVCFQSCRDILHVLRLSGTLGCKAYQFSTCVNDTFGLYHTTFSIVGIDGCHRLDADGVIASNSDIAYMSYSSWSSHGS